MVSVLKVKVNNWGSVLVTRSFSVQRFCTTEKAIIFLDWMRCDCYNSDTNLTNLKNTDHHSVKTRAVIKLNITRTKHVSEYKNYIYISRRFKLTAIYPIMRSLRLKFRALDCLNYKKYIYWYYFEPYWIK